MAAPCSNDRLSGSGKTLSAPRPTVSAAPPWGRQAATRSPAVNPEPSGAERTTPAKSTPRVKGSSGLSWYSPLLSRRSGNETPTAWTSTRTCGPNGPPAVGSGTSRTSTTFGPPRLVTWTARMGHTVPQPDGRPARGRLRIGGSRTPKLGGVDTGRPCHREDRVSRLGGAVAGESP